MSWSAAARPEGPEPIIAIFLPVRVWDFCVCKSLLIGVFNNSVLVCPYCDSVAVCTAGAGFFTKSRTNTGCKLRKIVCSFEPVIRFVPAALKDKVVPLRDKVVERTA